MDESEEEDSDDDEAEDDFNHADQEDDVGGFDWFAEVRLLGWLFLNRFSL